MIGPKKLSTIREELERAFVATGEDPLTWLEKRMACAKHQRTGDSESSDVLQSLKRFLEKPKKPRPRKQQLRAKK